VNEGDKSKRSARASRKAPLIREAEERWETDRLNQTGAAPHVAHVATPIGSPQRREHPRTSQVRARRGAYRLRAGWPRTPRAAPARIPGGGCGMPTVASNERARALSV